MLCRFLLKSGSIFMAGLVTILLAAPFPVLALTIDRPRIKIQLSQDKEYNGTIIVNNPSAREAFVKVYLEDFIYQPPFDGSKNFYSAGTLKYSITEWFNFSPREFKLAPGCQQRVNFTMKPSAKLTNIACGVLFFETSMGSSDEQGQKVNILGRLGSLIFVEPEDSRKTVSFTGIEGAVKGFTGKIKNTGNTFLHVSGTFFIMDKEGIAEDRGEIREFYFMPEDETNLEIGLAKSLISNNYTMVVTFDLEEGDVVVKEVDFSLSPLGEVKILDVRD